MANSNSTVSAKLNQKQVDWWKHKVCLVTGATAGIGRRTALALAEAGAQVHIVGRNPEKLKATRSMIVERTGNENVFTYKCDLSSQSEIHDLHKSFCANSEELHLLVNNAGIYAPQRQETVDGIESTWATNYLAYYLVSHLFMPQLEKTEHSQLVLVSGETARIGCIRWGDIQYSKRYSTLGAYAQSKLAIIMLGRELADDRPHARPSIKVMHPGPAATDHLQAGGGLLHAFWSRYLPGPDFAARSILRVANPFKLDENHGGYFFNSLPFMAPFPVWSKKKRQRLMAVSQEMVGTAAP